jgi:hypothetical protein
MMHFCLCDGIPTHPRKEDLKVHERGSCFRVKNNHAPKAPGRSVELFGWSHLDREGTK